MRQIVAGRPNFPSGVSNDAARTSRSTARGVTSIRDPFGDVTIVLETVSMTIFPGEVLMGGNGVGKSLTLYRLIGAPTAFLWRQIWWRELLRVWVDSARWASQRSGEQILFF